MPIDVNGTILSSDASGLSLTATRASVAQFIVGQGGSLRRRLPYFRASCGSQAISGSIAYGSPFKPTGVTHNVGSCWNATTGLFTAPVPGKYLAYMGGIAAGNLDKPAGAAQHGYFGILKNGATYAVSHWNHASHWMTATLEVPVECAAGDTISFCLNALPIIANNGNGWYAGGGHGLFYIVLAR